MSSKDSHEAEEDTHYEDSKSLLLPDNGSIEALLDRESSIEAANTHRRSGLWMMLLAGYSTVITVIYLNSLINKLEVPWNPVIGSVEYEVTPYDPDPTSVYAHPRTPAVDQAWEDLLATANIRITDAQMQAGHEDAERAKKFADGEGGYLGGLAVWHYLHCVNSLRQVITIKSYNDTSFEAPPLWHQEHCIELLRTALMCHADLSMFSIEEYIGADGQIQSRAQSGSRRTCVNWDSLDGWAEKRVAPKNRIIAEPDRSKLRVESENRNKLGVLIED